MNKESIHDALNLLDDDLVEAVEKVRGQTKKKKDRHRFKQWVVAAACLCLLVSAALVKPNGHNGDPYTAENETAAGNAATEVSEEAAEETEGYEETITDSMHKGVVIEPLMIDLGSYTDKVVDMEALFIYGGRSYVYYGTIEDASPMIGEYLGTATGLIDEWTPADGYVELAGSISGDFYAVNGFDSGFVLCMPAEDGTADVYLNNNDMTLYTGADLLQKRLHMNESDFTVSCISREDWYYNTGETVQLEGAALEEIRQLMETLNDAPFVYTSDIALPVEADTIFDTELFHLYLHMDNGMVIHLRLFEGGYIQLYGFESVCLQVGQERMDQALQSLYQSETGN